MAEWWDNSIWATTLGYEVGDPLSTNPAVETPTFIAPVPPSLAVGGLTPRPFAGGSPGDLQHGYQLSLDPYPSTPPLGYTARSLYIEQEVVDPSEAEGAAAWRVPPLFRNGLACGSVVLEPARIWVPGQGERMAPQEAQAAYFMGDPSGSGLLISVAIRTHPTEFAEVAVMAAILHHGAVVEAYPTALQDNVSVNQNFTHATWFLTVLAESPGEVRLDYGTPFGPGHSGITIPRAVIEGGYQATWALFTGSGAPWTRDAEIQVLREEGDVPPWSPDVAVRRLRLAQRANHRMGTNTGAIGQSLRMGGAGYR